MLRFKQFLSEDMPWLDDEHPESSFDREFRAVDLRQRLKYIDSRRGKEEFKKIGSIGPYEVHHVHSQFTGSQGDVFRTHHIMVTHNGKPVGAVNFSEEKPSTEYPAHFSAQGPVFVPRHSGSRSDIHALPARVYHMVANHFNMPIVSGGTQTRGSKNLWGNLAKMGRVSAINVRSGEQIAHYNPDNPEHVETAYPSTSRGNQAGHYWLMVHHPEKKS